MRSWLGVSLVALLIACHADPAKPPDAAIDSAMIDSALDAPPDVPVDALSVISYVQGASMYRSTATYPSATFAQPTTAGNLIVLVICWYSVSGDVFSISDGAGNTYTLATGTGTQNFNLAMYYAANAAPATQVSVTMNATVSSADVHIAEYSGLATVNPMEIASSKASQTSSTSTTGGIGQLLTTHPHDLLVIATGLENTAAPGVGYTQRLLEDANILEDKEVYAAGAQSGTAEMDANSSLYLMGMMALKAAD